MGFLKLRLKIPELAINQQLGHVYLRRYTQGRSSGHSIRVGQLVPWNLDYPTVLECLGYQADQEGPGFLSVLHQAGLRMKEKQSQSPVNIEEI